MIAEWFDLAEKDDRLSIVDDVDHSKRLFDAQKGNSAESMEPKVWVAPLARPTFELLSDFDQRSNELRQVTEHFRSVSQFFNAFATSRKD
jgi:hypothetical protein